MTAATRSVGAVIVGDEILSGKRNDRHFANLRAALAPRGLAPAWVRYVGDDRPRLTQTLRETFATGDIVFSFGGIGATPDDHTRQAAAAALGRKLFRHPDAIREIEARFGADAYPHRVMMGEFPEGSTIIPNPVNRIAGFRVESGAGAHHFLPGFPDMAWPMFEWVMATHYPDLRAAVPQAERAITVFDAGESQLIPLMDVVVAAYPELKLFSLPHMLPDGGRRIELGVKGDATRIELALAALRDGVDALGFRWEPGGDDAG
jgi:molybdopterin-biosynthesis enzyme MoeA-like protein